MFYNKHKFKADFNSCLWLDEHKTHDINCMLKPNKLPKYYSPLVMCAINVEQEIFELSTQASWTQIRLINFKISLVVLTLVACAEKHIYNSDFLADNALPCFSLYISLDILLHTFLYYMCKNAGEKVVFIINPFPRDTKMQTLHKKSCRIVV